MLLLDDKAVMPPEISTQNSPKEQTTIRHITMTVKFTRPCGHTVVYTIKNTQVIKRSSNDLL